MDSASACLVSVFGMFLFYEWTGMELSLSCGLCHFLCSTLLPISLLDSRLHPLIQICCLDFVLSTSTPKFNYFDYTTYLDLVIKVEQDLLFMVMSWFAPRWLLGSCRFTNQLHSNLDIEVPQMVVDTFLVGGKYLSPIVMKKSLVKESWTEFCDHTLKSWARSYHDNDRENDSDDEDPFYSIPIPFKLKGHVLPFEGKPDKSIMHILHAGWRELNSLLSNVPNLDRNDQSIEVELKEVLEWLFAENILMKATDKNLGTALVSMDWYESKVSSFLLSNKGYTFISEDEACTLIQHMVKRICALCYFNSTTWAFVKGNLSQFLGSRLLPPHVEVDSLL